MAEILLPKKRYADDLLEGKVALVSGSGSGMGRATAIEMARCGAKIALYGRTLEKLESTAEVIKSVGGEALPIQGDTRELEQIQAAYDQIKSHWGKLDILVNNAGGQYVSPARDITPKGFDTVIRNNLNATWYMTKLAADNFMFENGGRIINVTAVVKQALSGFAHSVAARGGVVALARTLAHEWAQYGILINCVAPGTIKSFPPNHYPIADETWETSDRNLLNRMGKAEDISGMITFLASELGDFITGEEFYVDAGETLNVSHSAASLIDPDLKAKQGR